MSLFNNDFKRFSTYDIYWYKRQQRCNFNPHLSFINYFSLGDLKYSHLAELLAFWTSGIFRVHYAKVHLGIRDCQVWTT